jgi:hypothetical protein
VVFTQIDAGGDLFQARLPVKILFQKQNRLLDPLIVFRQLLVIHGHRFHRMVPPSFATLPDYKRFGQENHPILAVFSPHPARDTRSVDTQERLAHVLVPRLADHLVFDQLVRGLVQRARKKSEFRAKEIRNGRPYLRLEQIFW